MMWKLYILVRKMPLLESRIRALSLWRPTIWSGMFIVRLENLRRLLIRLRSNIFNRSEKSTLGDMIIQPFVMGYIPKIQGKGNSRLLVTKHNWNFSTIICKWSKNLLILEKVSNVNKFDEEEIDFHQRVITFEDAKGTMTKTEPIVSECLINDIKVAWNLIQWQFRINKIRLDRITLYFRIDKN